ncbi:hypothetical protein NO932_09135 [Pelagibacterium sp. 26DY04]|uniref:hypothetical protein n=1 Tax=unclassified Pelagibacterium TaxID=2623280 RepID=UPI0028156EFD|nr:MULTISPECIES: hypothetical protein [unclassified Pelagibacterium]WMT88749.1 hypothetical protein NO932_09135 [Pelagibacterium sp. 26DY04]WMT90594.1 hypothetical protein NO934_17750 [Pelagibacterium sp. H642]
MKLSKYALAIGVLLAGAGTATAQPQTKLVNGLDKAMIQAIWCSALFFEESYYHEAESDEALRYEDLAFDLGADIDTLLLDHGMRQEEVDEIWSIFDSAAYDLAEMDDESFLVQVETCESNYDNLL